MTPTAGVDIEPFAPGAIVVTASHNPAEWNGLKCLVCDEEEQLGRAPTAEEANQIISLFNDGAIEYVTADELGEVALLGSESANKFHCDVVRSRYSALVGDTVGELAAHQMRIVLDSVNASGSVAAESLLRSLGSNVLQLAGDRSGVFPHTPEPTKENLSGEGGLCDVVPGVKADVGFAQDPDADRLAIVDERGEYIGEEYTLVLCAMALMEARAGDDDGEDRGKPVFVVNLSTSRMIDDVAAHYGGEVVRSAVGEANVVEIMKSLKAQGRYVVFGGEGNGGVIWPEVTYVRDSLSGMALVLSLMARTGKSVSKLVEMVNSFGPTDEVKANGYTILKAKSDLASKADAVPVVEHLNGVYGSQDGCRVDLQDGIRIDWDERGVWAHVRASNTEPIMRVIVEAPSRAEAERVAGEIDGHILGA